MRRLYRLMVTLPLTLLAEDHGPHHTHTSQATHSHETGISGHPAYLTGSPHHPHLDHQEAHHPWFHLQPHATLAVAVGGSTSEKNLGLIRGGHAPVDDGMNFQALELGAVAEFGEKASAHLNHNLFWDRFDHWDGEWEDAFAAFQLPHDLSLRSGQFLAPFGQENTFHLHDREFVEPPISMIRLLGEHGLYVQGAELAWTLPHTAQSSVLRFGYGQARTHSHGPVREERSEAYREAIEHQGEGDHDEEHHEELHHSHGLAGNGGIFDVENAYLDDGFFFLRLESTAIPCLDRAGLSFAGGKNGFDRHTWIWGADIFREFVVADRPAWFRSEVFFRSVEAHDAAGAPGDYEESGIYASCGCEFVKDWTTAARLEWASGNRLAGNERRWRASANVGHHLALTSRADLHTRLQYSFDDLGGYGSEHSVWLQFVLNLGAAEHGHPH